MANEIRLRRNNIAGTTTDNPLTNVATTINSPGFVDLPVVDATNHLILILDPLETNGPAEIVRVTTHTAAASVVTVVRGAEGSAARSHASGTTWFHGPITSDTTEVLTSSTRPVIPYEGQLIYETDTNNGMFYDGTAWRPFFGANHAVRATRITSDQALVANAFTVAVMNSEIYDESGAYNPATGVYTVPETGVYSLAASFRVDVSAPPFFCAITTFLNGVAHQTLASLAAADGAGGNVSGYSESRLTAGQTIDFRVFIGAGEVSPVIGRVDDSGVFNNIWIHKI